MWKCGFRALNDVLQSDFDAKIASGILYIIEKYLKNTYWFRKYSEGTCKIINK